MAERFLETEGNIFIAALDDNIPIGFLAAYRLPRIDSEKAMILIYELEVGPDYRGRGTGRKLLENIKEIAADDNIVKMWVLTNRSNRAAVGLYQSCGGIPGGGEDMMMLEFYPPFRAQSNQSV